MNNVPVKLRRTFSPQRSAGTRWDLGHVHSPHSKDCTDTLIAAGAPRHRVEKVRRRLMGRSDNSGISRKPKDGKRKTNQKPVGSWMTSQATKLAAAGAPAPAAPRVQPRKSYKPRAKPACAKPRGAPVPRQLKTDARSVYMFRSCVIVLWAHAPI